VRLHTLTAARIYRVASARAAPLPRACLGARLVRDARVRSGLPHSLAGSESPVRRGAARIGLAPRLRGAAASGATAAQDAPGCARDDAQAAGGGHGCGAPPAPGAPRGAAVALPCVLVARPPAHLVLLLGAPLRRSRVPARGRAPVCGRAATDATAARGGRVPLRVRARLLPAGQLGPAPRGVQHCGRHRRSCRAFRPRRAVQRRCQRGRFAPVGAFGAVAPAPAARLPGPQGRQSVLIARVGSRQEHGPRHHAR